MVQYVVVYQSIIRIILAFPHLERQGFLFYIQFSETIESQLNIFTNKNHNVMIKKTYENPESELITVRFEENVMSPVVNSTNHTEYLGVEEDGGDLS